MEHNKEKSHPVQQYFSFSTENNASQCTLCKTQLKGRHSSNLLRHLKSHHARTYEMIVPLIKQYHQSRSEKEKNITATFNLAKVTKALVCLVAVDGRPFSLMDDVGLKSLLDPIFNACDKNGVPYRINRRNIADHVTEYEKKIEKQIIEEIQGKLVTAQRDVATIHERYCLYPLRIQAHYL